MKVLLHHVPRVEEIADGVGVPPCQVPLLALVQKVVGLGDPLQVLFSFIRPD